MKSCQNWRLKFVKAMVPWSNGTRELPWWVAATQGMKDQDIAQHVDRREMVVPYLDGPWS
jgi:hypothetical protein